MLCVSLMIGVAASAQIRIISKERLDSLSNPALAENSASMQFDTQRIAADPMTEDDTPAPFVYRFRNVSDRQIMIRRLSTTCPCTEAKCDKQVVEPGDYANVTVTYNPKGHPGSFERKVFLYTDDNSRPSAILRLAVRVGTGSDTSGLFKENLGKIRVRSRSINVTSFRKSVERLSFLNVSGGPLKLECEKLMLPGCLQFRSEPEVVEDGEEGEIIITFDPEKYAEGTRKQRMQVVLKGMGLPPSQSSIIVIVDK